MGNSLFVQWLGLSAFSAGDWVLFPKGTKIPQPAKHSQKPKNKKVYVFTINTLPHNCSGVRAYTNLHLHQFHYIPLYAQ